MFYPFKRRILEGINQYSERFTNREQPLPFSYQLLLSKDEWVQSIFLWIVYNLLSSRWRIAIFTINLIRPCRYFIDFELFHSEQLLFIYLKKMLKSGIKLRTMFSITLKFCYTTNTEKKRTPKITNNAGVM